MSEALEQERVAIQSMLSDWGIWRRIEDGYLIPPHMRLRTGGGDIYDTSDVLERTNEAVMHLREISMPHYLVIRAKYKDYPGDTMGHILKKLPPELGIKHKSQLSEMVKYAEGRIASYRHGAAG